MRCYRSSHVVWNDITKTAVVNIEKGWRADKLLMIVSDVTGKMVVWERMGVQLDMFGKAYLAKYYPKHRHAGDVNENISMWELDIYGIDFEDC